MKENPFIIFGAGGHAKVVIEAARAASIYPDLVIDDNPLVAELLGLNVLQTGKIELKSLAPFRFVIAIGNNGVRQKIFESMRAIGGSAQSLIHPFTSISPTATLGDGTVVFAGAVLNSNATIGENCILNTGSRIDHDCKIESHAHICPGVTLAGIVSVGTRTIIGAGASCIPGISIGSDCVIGAGSVVVRDLRNDIVAYGNPAKARRESKTIASPTHQTSPAHSS